MAGDARFHLTEPDQRRALTRRLRRRVLRPAVTPMLGLLAPEQFGSYPMPAAR